jgi:hypothetical protein
MTAVINFKTEYRRNLETGKDEPVHWVKLAPSVSESEKVSTWHRVEKLKPFETNDSSVSDSPSYQAMKGRWEIVEPAFKAWLDGSEIPENGTPLGAWAALTAEQAEIFRGLKIRTVEDVAAMRDGDIQRIPLPNARQLKGLAAEFLKGQDTAHAQKEVADLREQMAAMQAMLDEQTKPKAKPKSEAA